MGVEPVSKVQVERNNAEKWNLTILIDWAVELSRYNEVDEQVGGRHHLHPDRPFSIWWRSWTGRAGRSIAKSRIR